MALASLTTYWIMTGPVALLFGKPTTEIGALWAVISTVFVYRDTRAHSAAAGISRLIATFVSFLLCSAYLILFPSTGVGMAALIAIGAALMIVVGRPDDATTTAVTIAVIMVVAAMSPREALQQPILRLFDTFVGVVLGVLWKSLASLLYALLAREAPR